jgi:hypothetical protein
VISDVRLCSSCTSCSAANHRLQGPIHQGANAPGRTKGPWLPVAGGAGTGRPGGPAQSVQREQALNVYHAALDERSTSL